MASTRGVMRVYIRPERANAGDQAKAGRTPPETKKEHDPQQTPHSKSNTRFGFHFSLQIGVYQIASKLRETQLCRGMCTEVFFKVCND
jgi:hypothetical protein